MTHLVVGEETHLPPFLLDVVVDVGEGGGAERRGWGRLAELGVAVVEVRREERDEAEQG